MHANCPIRLALAVLLALPLLVHATSGDAPRFSVKGELKPVAASADGRFALSGQARVTAQPTSADGRFGLKSALASCDPLDTILFRNGFEGP